MYVCNRETSSRLSMFYERSYPNGNRKQNGRHALKPASDLHVRADDDLHARPGTL